MKQKWTLYSSFPAKLYNVVSFTFDLPYAGLGMPVSWDSCRLVHEKCWFLCLLFNFSLFWGINPNFRKLPIKFKPYYWVRFSAEFMSDFLLRKCHPTVSLLLGFRNGSETLQKSSQTHSCLDIIFSAVTAKRALISI